MLPSVLIANRGEIAVRVIRTARRLGLRTIAVYSDADRKAMHVRLADEAYRIGPAAAAQSYLSIPTIIAAARESGAACIHPGYGFLSERAEFAEACAEAGIVFVGPPPAAIRAMGLKDGAKALMEKAGVPVVPGYHGERQDEDFLAARAAQIGYPVLIKAVAGGGGKGMKRVDRPKDFGEALASAQREAKAAFGDARVLIEKYVTAPRHIEIQVFADTHGNVVHLNERDCSLQRRHQKVIEESPAPGMSREVREAMGRAAVEAARAIGYVGAGTVEFIADGASGLRVDGWWFMEMNTRLQVEHPVTELVTGLDLVEWQFRVASGEPLPIPRQEDVPLRGHAVEARLYAEDPERGFLPSTGRLHVAVFPDAAHVRIDTGVEAGSEVTPFYDPMIAKVIASGETRDEALDRLAGALEATRIAGPRTNAAFLVRLARAEAFRAGDFDTGFIDRHREDLGAVPMPPDAGAVAAGVARLVAREQERLAAAARARTGSAPLSRWDVSDGFRLGPPRPVDQPVIVDGEAGQAAVSFSPGGPQVTFAGVAPADDAFVVDVGPGVLVLRGGRQVAVRLADVEAVDVDHLDTGGLVVSPLHGRVVAVLVKAGDAVAKGQRLAVLEAMKMEHALLAPRDGIVSDITAAEGLQVAEGARLMVVGDPS